MTHGSLFSGIGGFDLAAQWMGWENRFHCEWNEFGKRVLKYYWPKADSHDDITKTDFTKYNGTIELISGGFPCQPYSSAGKRLGKADDRHLWPHMLRAIKEVAPRWVVGENVRGLLTGMEGWYSTRCVLTWKILGIKSRPILYLRAQSMHHTEEKEFGLLPTPMAQQRNTTEEQTKERQTKYGGKTRAMYLENFAVMGMLPTPRANKVNGCNLNSENLANRNKWNLEESVAKWVTKLLPTPVAGEYRDTGEGVKTGNFKQMNLTRTIAKDNPEWTGKTSQLNPQFVAEMMGFPTNWTELPFQSGETNQSKHTETQ